MTQCESAKIDSDWSRRAAATAEGGVGEGKKKEARRQRHLSPPTSTNLICVLKLALKLALKHALKLLVRFDRNSRVNHPEN